MSHKASPWENGFVATSGIPDDSSGQRGKELVASTMLKNTARSLLSRLSFDLRAESVLPSSPGSRNLAVGEIIAEGRVTL